MSKRVSTMLLRLEEAAASRASSSLSTTPAELGPCSGTSKATRGRASETRPRRRARASGEDEDEIISWNDRHLGAPGPGFGGGNGAAPQKSARTGSWSNGQEEPRWIEAATGISRWGADAKM